MRKWFIRISVALLLIVIGLAGWAVYQLRDRHPGYELSLQIEPAGPDVRYRAGFGKQPVTPTVTDTWNDVDGNAKYQPKKGDTYNDVNGNGEFDAVWIAGFSNAKPANGVHDDVWARAIVLDDGQTRLAMVSLDAVGFLHDDIVDIREMLPDSLGITYTQVASTHTHESNDLIGIWGPDPFHSGVDPELLRYVKTQTVRAISEAVANLRPAHFIVAEELSGRDSILIKDTRKPIVKATGVHVLQAIDAESGQTLGSLVNWANHPETLWSGNLLISSDFPHYLREGMEKGVRHEGDTIRPGLGGTCVFFNGAVGGLMTPHPSLPFTDPIRDTIFAEPSFEKTRTLGEQIALLAYDALEGADTLTSLRPLALQAETILLPLDNKIFQLATILGIINRGCAGWLQTRTEVAAFRAGPATFLSIPGEIYPEIISGGIESPPGRDFEIDPVEVPPLQELMPGRYHFYLGLANDEIGYIIPKSEWDNEEPWLYLDESDTYGEENSLGPETAPLLHQAWSKLLSRLGGQE